MALGPRAVSAVLGADEKLVSWFKETWIPDQGFFHTVLYNDPVLLLRNERLTYVVSQRFARERKDWMVLRAEDFDDIASSGAVFARKVDPSIDAAVGRLIDDHLDCARARASSSER